MATIETNTHEYKCLGLAADIAKAASLLIASPALASKPAPITHHYNLPSHCPKSCQRALEILEKALAALRGGAQETVRTEYTRLFVAAYPSTPCPPYESVYTWRRRLLGNPAVIRDLNKIAAAVGLEYDRSKEGLPDHAAVELELAYAISKMVAANHAELAPYLRKLVEDHLGRWIGLLASCIRSNARLELYRLIADLLEASVECLLHSSPATLPRQRAGGK